MPLMTPAQLELLIDRVAKSTRETNTQDFRDRLYDLFEPFNEACPPEPEKGTY